MKLQLEAKKLHQQDQKMVLDAHEQDRKAAQDHADRQADIAKTAATLADNVQQRQTEQLVNQEETARAVLSLRTAPSIQAGADVTQEQIARDTAIAEKLIEHATGHDRAKADVKIAEHDHAASDRQARPRRRWPRTASMPSGTASSPSRRRPARRARRLRHRSRGRSSRMHHADWASARLREIDESVEKTAGLILAGTAQDMVAYQRAVARRVALLEVRELLRVAIGADS
jgi:hypothetical protein